MAAIAALFGIPQRSHAQSRSVSSTQKPSNDPTSLDALVLRLQGEGKFQEAVPLAQQSLALREKALGPHHLDVAQSLVRLAELYRVQGAYAKAEPLYVRAFDIRREARGWMHPDVAQSLDHLATLLHVQGAYAVAEPLYVCALDIRGKMLGPMHPDVAESLNNLANLYQTQWAYVKAPPLYLRALNLREKAVDPIYPNMEGSLSLPLEYCQKHTDYQHTKLAYSPALTMVEFARGMRHPDASPSARTFAALYWPDGAYAKAEPLYIRALGIREKVLGAMHPDVARSLNDLALLYSAQGVYTKAESLYVRALDIREKTLGPIHPEVAVSLSNLATLYRDQGAYVKAERMLVRALDIREKALGPIHPDVAVSLSNLATLYQDQGAYAEPEPLLIRALEIQEKALGSMHPQVARSLNDLAVLYSDHGAYAKAELLYVRALDIDERVLGTRHLDIVTILNNLAVLYQNQKSYAKAELLDLRALRLGQEMLGVMHPKVARSLTSLAKLYQAQGAYTKAIGYLSLALEIQEQQLRQELSRLSAPRKRALMMVLRADTEHVISLHADAMPDRYGALWQALTTVLRRKGRDLDSLADNQGTLRVRLTPSLHEKLDQLAQVSNQLSIQLHAPFDPRTAANRASEIAALRARIEDLESILNAASSEFRAQSELVTVEKIRAALPRGAALVEFVGYRRYDARQAKPWQEARYVAYILPWQGPVQWVSLGAAAPIDAGVDAVLTAMQKGAHADGTKAALQQLDALVFAPIRERLTDISHVILSPDGKLNLVPFEALIDRQGHYEIERHLVSYVTSGRDLLRRAVRRAPRSPVTTIAAPDYGPGTLFPLLAGATAEAQEIQKYFRGARLLAGWQATKAALAAVIGPAVLHIATHGFYARDAAAAPAPPLPGRLRGVSVEDALAAVPPLPSLADPAEALDRAGLALAGANAGGEGIVSARELATYDWWGAELVVLSACETGVGAVPSGEGVYGMRRALVLAGAQSQVVSLWRVDDAATPALMHAFYGELARGTGRAEALRRAKLAMLRQPRFASPYYWAAFIAAGDWAPLDKRLRITSVASR